MQQRPIAEDDRFSQLLHRLSSLSYHSVNVQQGLDVQYMGAPKIRGALVWGPSQKGPTI